MNGIGVLADRHTSTCFKLAGVRNVFTVNDHTQAEKMLLEILEKTNLRILLVSEKIFNSIQKKNQFSEQQLPLIIPMPTMQTREAPKTDFMAELIKRKTGIEVKL